MAPLPSPNCAWLATSNDPRCSDPAYAGPYPSCALYQSDDRSPIPCQGLVGAGYCEFTGPHANSTPPTPASWHVHLFFPNVNCTNCTSDYTSERPGFTYAGAMQLRGQLSSQLNAWTEALTGRPPRDPISAERAAADASYNQCGDTYRIVAGAPANYHPEPCIFEVDAYKRPGPFTDPATRLGYPNYSFLLPGATWMPGLLALLEAWLLALGPAWGQYDVLLHPNTGCEVRDHVEPRSIRWLQGTPRALLPEVFSCRALGCNQACPEHGSQPLPAPANCSHGSARAGVPEGGRTLGSRCC